MRSLDHIIWLSSAARVVTTAAQQQRDLGILQRKDLRSSYMYRREQARKPFVIRSVPESRILFNIIPQIPLWTVVFPPEPGLGKASQLWLSYCQGSKIQYSRLKYKHSIKMQVVSYRIGADHAVAHHSRIKQSALTIGHRQLHTRLPNTASTKRYMTKK